MKDLRRSEYCDWFFCSGLNDASLPQYVPWLPGRVSRDFDSPLRLLLRPIVVPEHFILALLKLMRSCRSLTLLGLRIVSALGAVYPLAHIYSAV